MCKRLLVHAYIRLQSNEMCNCKIGIHTHIYTYMLFNRESLIHPSFSFCLFVSLWSTSAEEIHGSSLKNKCKRISVDRMQYISLHFLLRTANQICLFGQTCFSLGFIRFVIWSISFALRSNIQWFAKVLLSFVLYKILKTLKNLETLLVLL